MQSTDRPFIPAAGHDFALSLYDPFTRLSGVDGLRRELIERAQLQPGQRVLDIGCGTGTLVIAAKRSCPQAELVGVDPDARALERARRKAARAGLQARFEKAYGDELPFADGTFDHVFSSFMLHHLDPSTQSKLVSEARRVLVPGGSFHLLDLAHSGHARRGLLHRLHRSGPQPHVQSEDAVHALLSRAGFESITKPAQRRLFWAQMLCYVARAPGAGASSAYSSA